MKALVEEVRKIIKKIRWLVLSTVGEQEQPHSSVVVYQSDGYDLYIQTGENTLKTKTIRKNNKVSVTIPFRKDFLHKIIPAPPAELHFKAIAEFISKDNEKARDIMAKVLKYEKKAKIEQETIWIKIKPSNIVSTFGVGVKLMDMRKPEKARNLINLDA